METSFFLLKEIPPWSSTASKVDFPAARDFRPARADRRAQVGAVRKFTLEGMEFMETSFSC